MRLHTLITLILTGVFSSLPAQSRPQTQNHNITLPKEKLQPFLQKHCVACHGPDKQKGQVRLDQGPWSIADNDSAQRWQDVLDQLNAGDMPPIDEDQPTQDELITVLGSLTTTLHEARQKLNSQGGEITMRRLNRREYKATIDALFGFDIDPYSIPEDGEIQTFDTVGDEQFFTSVHFDRYFELGKKIATQSLRLNTRPHKKPKITKKEAETNQINEIKRKLKSALAQKALKESGASYKKMKFISQKEMDDYFKKYDKTVKNYHDILNDPVRQKGLLVATDSRLANFGINNADPRASYNIKIQAGIYQSDPSTTISPLRRLLYVYGSKGAMATRQITGSSQKPSTVLLSVRPTMENQRVNARLSQNISKPAYRRATSVLDKQAKENNRPNKISMWLDWVEIEGPLYPEQRPIIEDILFPDRPTGSRNEYINLDHKVRTFLEKFTYEAFRHQTPDSIYIDALHTHFTKLRKKGLKFNDALTEVIGIVLSSPSFLFIQEQAPPSHQPHKPLSNRELAIRLSYYLWSSPPDAELYAANLTNPRIYEKQIDRLLASPRAQAFTTGFMDQWAELDRFQAVSIDPSDHLFYNDGLRHAAKLEMNQFFHTLIKENLPVENLIDSSFITVNGTLAAHYGIPFQADQSPNTFKKIKLPPHSPRGGLLTQAYFLMVGSNGERSSPVIRGALVMEKILHDKPAPPPPNVPELGSNITKPHTNRDLVLMHQQQAVCASCHQKMDVIGFGLENFDSIGRWRSLEQVGKKFEPIIPGGTLNKQPFKNVQQLKTILLTQKHKLAKELTESIFTYALGRRIEFSDQTAIEDILTKTKPNNHRTQDIIKQIALSPLFRKP
ncbi:MAG: DUF1588 domain-containing protein [Akkermansiaceae bacterium]